MIIIIIIIIIRRRRSVNVIYPAGIIVDVSVKLPKIARQFLILIFGI
jgi:hypothetical protein